MTREYYRYVNGKKTGRPVKAANKGDAIRKFVRMEEAKGKEVTPISRTAKRALKGESLSSSDYFDHLLEGF